MKIKNGLKSLVLSSAILLGASLPTQADDGLVAGTRFFDGKDYESRYLYSNETFIGLGTRNSKDIIGMLFLGYTEHRFKENYIGAEQSLELNIGTPPHGRLTPYVSISLGLSFLDSSSVNYFRNLKGMNVDFTNKRIGADAGFSVVDDNNLFAAAGYGILSKSDISRNFEDGLTTSGWFLKFMKIF